MSSHGSQSSTTYEPHYSQTSQQPPGALVPHPSYHPQHQQIQTVQQQEQPPYSRYNSHASHYSHHSHSYQYDNQYSDKYEDDKDLERRPTMGDTLVLMWRTVVGAVTGKRR